MPVTTWLEIHRFCLCGQGLGCVPLIQKLAFGVTVPYTLPVRGKLSRNRHRVLFLVNQELVFEVIVHFVLHLNLIKGHRDFYIALPKLRVAD